MHLTTADLISIGEALRYAADRLRYEDEPGDVFGPNYRRSVVMEGIADRITSHLSTMPASVTVEV